MPKFWYKNQKPCLLVDRRQSKRSPKLNLHPLLHNLKLFHRQPMTSSKKVRWLCNQQVLSNNRKKLFTTFRLLQLYMMMNRKSKRHLSKWCSIDPQMHHSIIPLIFTHRLSTKTQRPNRNNLLSSFWADTLRWKTRSNWSWHLYLQRSEWSNAP